MINRKGRLQKLNQAVRPPGQARDDWEILRDLLQALTGSNSIYSLDDVFRQMSEAIPPLSGLTFSSISDQGVQVLNIGDSPAPPAQPGADEIERAAVKAPASIVR